MYKVNDVFLHKNGAEYVIKGAWDGRYPDNAHAWLTRSDGTGHAYAGRVTKVNTVWKITNKEFKDMAGNRPEWFIKKKEGKTQ